MLNCGKKFLDFSKIEKSLAGEPEFRSKQVKQLVLSDLIEDWNEATTLPIELREKLTKECPLEIKAAVFISKDQRSVKALMELRDGLKIETVLMRHSKDIAPSQSPPLKGGEEKRGRNTVCVSSQVGCALGCNFCATGKLGFKRNLTEGEIVSQVLFWARWLKKSQTGHSEGEARRISREREKVAHSGEILRFAQDDKNKKKDARVDNIVFMGMGEPLLNYENVMAAIRTVNDPRGLAIGARHISISTVGIIEGIERLTREEIQVNLAISLHAPTDELRLSFMPINKKYPIKKVLEAVDKYIAKTRRKVMFEYIMIKGINDSDKQARELAGLMKRPLYFVNLIQYNPTGAFVPSSAARIKKFKDILEKAGIQALQRYRFGEEIGAACGQLAGGEK